MMLALYILCAAAALGLVALGAWLMARYHWEEDQAVSQDRIQDAVSQGHILAKNWESGQKSMERVA
jgi:hypothetical protein